MAQRLIWNFEYSPPLIVPLWQTEMEQEDLKWEIRFFWTDDRIIDLYAIDHALLDIASYQQKHKEDCYYLLPESNYNIKRRHDEIFYKPILKQTPIAVGYGAKINLSALKDYPHQETIHLNKIARQALKQGKEVLVKKEAFIYKFNSHPSTKLELGRLEVDKKIYFSLCIEGKSLYTVETINKCLLDKYVSCDYVTFLKNIIKP